MYTEAAYPLFALLLLPILLFSLGGIVWLVARALSRVNRGAVYSVRPVTSLS